jgi:hypothetical protein
MFHIILTRFKDADGDIYKFKGPTDNIILFDLIFTQEITFITLK